MQQLRTNSINEIRKAKIKQLEEEFKEFRQMPIKTLFQCPFCFYQSPKTKRFSCIIFQGDSSLVLNCFACRKWRRL